MLTQTGHHIQPRDPASRRAVNSVHIWNQDEELITVRDARVWAFVEEGFVLPGETLGKAEAEGRKLLTDLRES